MNIQSQPTISDITAAIDHDDLRSQAHLFQSILEHDTSVKAGQLRHRATMMRQRADEFDKLADHIEDAANEIILKTGRVVPIHEEIVTVLNRHAHIEPTKT